jgi:hypothetical protein
MPEYCLQENLSNFLSILFRLGIFASTFDETNVGSSVILDLLLPTKSFLYSVISIAVYSRAVIHTS